MGLEGCRGAPFGGCIYNPICPPKQGCATGIDKAIGGTSQALCFFKRCLEFQSQGNTAPTLEQALEVFFCLLKYPFICSHIILL